MLIRPATSEDKPAMMELLKKSLGESVIPISETFWNWKHEQNPFGSSYVLLADQNGKLVGLRAFMQWKWQWHGEVFSAIRAVDTATHPDFQGKGIFKKLTLQLLESCQQDGVHFVFNTPNESSKPGYLKMGWEEQGKMPIKLKIRKPFSLMVAKLFNRQGNGPVIIDPSPVQAWESKVIQLVDQAVQSHSRLATVHSSSYVSWRYAHNPLFRYNYFTDNENFLLISRIKRHSFAKELRLVDFILLKSRADETRLSAFMKKEVLAFCAKNDINLVTISGEQYKEFERFFQWMGIIPVRALGPVITLRNLNMGDRFPDLLEPRHWSYSLGDMELF
ncbi:MAG TPA: GNAT family N-acetyltransferase [Flavisolibacter sp.]|nr:GNAT family N-acetyltransferase [Flavisolibacter sp.]